jgi:hypothetical protein
MPFSLVSDFTPLHITIKELPRKKKEHFIHYYAQREDLHGLTVVPTSIGTNGFHYIIKRATTYL